MIMQSQSSHNLVVGAGLTGMSCLRYLDKQGLSVSIYDDAIDEKRLEEIHALSSLITVFDKSNTVSLILKNVTTVLVSPGVSLNHPLISSARSLDIELIGDIELFARENTKPVIAVTGSNGKSTVVTLLSLMAEEAGRHVALAGNIGKPVLDYLDDDSIELFVLELSSFQLDVTKSLHKKIACILNVSPDHMDRYDSFESYVDSKQRIYAYSESVCFNRQDPHSKPLKNLGCSQISFGLNEPAEGHYGLLEDSGGVYLSFGKEKIIAKDDLLLNRKVDVENALAALAMARSIGIDKKVIIKVLSEFSGLPHRCEFVKNENGVSWFNDSKATNVGATQAALQSFSGKSVILIAGGDAKGADLSLLKPSLQENVKYLLVIGKDAHLFKKLFSDICRCEVLDSMHEAVTKARNIAIEGDLVLLSPACSSLDMFSSYQQRGDYFKSLVLEDKA